MNKLLLYHQRAVDYNDNLKFKEESESQEIFVRDNIGNIFPGAHIFVVSYHKSKSIDLPVYGIIARNGLSIVLRNNFYNWVVSIKLPHNISNCTIIKNLINNGYNDSGISYIYCEGFKKEWVYGPYISNNENCKEFTVCIYNNYNLYTLLYIINSMINNFISFNEDNRTKEEIIKSIDNIYYENGVYDKDDDDYQLMYEHEILTNTLDALSNIELSHSYDIIKDKDRLTKCIMRYPEVKSGFLMDEYMYNYKF